MRKHNLAIAFVASMFIAVPLACSSSSSDGTTGGGDAGSGGSDGGSGGGDSGSAGSDGGSGNRDSGTSSDSGTLADGGSGITGCGDNGDPGNSVGIGKYCTLSECTNGNICATLGGDNTDTWCTKPCTAPDAGGSPTACGAGASCQCQDNQCGCTPDACL